MKKFMKTQVGRFIAGLLAFLIVVAVTSGVQRLSFLKADVTAQQVMSLSETSLEIAKEIEKDVTISYIATDGSKELWVEELAMKYAAANDHIAYEMVAPSANKATQLAVQVGESLAENALVVTCGDRSTAIAAEDLYSVVYNQTYLYYYGEYVVDEQYFVADELLVNALLYVTRDDLPVVYAMTGHGETGASSYMLDQFRMSNVVVKTLNLTDAVPEDAAAVMILAPTVDLTDEETEAMLTYLKNGGDLILMTGYMMDKLPNLEIITAYYGMEQIPGVVIDNASGYCYSTDYPQYIKPDVAEHAVTTILSEAGLKATMSLAGAMQRGAINRSGLTVTELLTTSDTAHMKTTLEVTTLEMEEGDPVGPFTVAMAAEEGDTHVVWYGSGTFLSDDEISISYGYNLYLLDSTLSWMMPINERVIIEAENLLATTLVVPAEQTTMIIIVMFIPALLALIVGFVAKKKK